MRGTLLIIVAFSVLMSAYADDIEWKDKEVEDITPYPDIPDNGDSIKKKEVDESVNESTIKKETRMGGWFGKPCTFKVCYVTWDWIIKNVLRDINTQMLTEEEAESLISGKKEGYLKNEIFTVLTYVDDAQEKDGNLENWNVILFDENGNRYEPVEIDHDELKDISYEYFGSTLYVFRRYGIYFDKLPEDKGKIELVIAGGYSDDKKLGFRWIFK
jgi:hypothetical protein